MKLNKKNYQDEIDFALAQGNLTFANLLIMVKKFPNDAELGKEVRNLIKRITNIKKQKKCQK